jgi:DNA-binding transcriptional LysR family regulator
MARRPLSELRSFQNSTMKIRYQTNAVADTAHKGARHRPPEPALGGRMFDLRSLDLNLLTVFEATYELGTVSNAADRLALSQSAASHALSRLRKACRDELFVRGPKGLIPTTTANAMYPVIKQALEALRASLAEATGFDPVTSRHHFRLSIPHPMGPFYAMDLRKTVAATAPGVTLAFDTISQPISLEDALRDGIVDIAIDSIAMELDPFVNRKLFDDRMVLVARENHPRVRTGVTLEELRHEEFIGMQYRREVGHLPQALRELNHLHLREVLRVSGPLEIPTVVASTDLLGVIPASAGPLLEKRLRLRVLAIPFELPALPIYMIWHESRRKDAAHVWLREIVVAKFGHIGAAREPGARPVN